MPQNAKGRQEPYDHANHHDGIEDLFDLPVHGNVIVDQPEQHADDYECYYKGNHFYLSREIVNFISSIEIQPTR